MVFDAGAMSLTTDWCAGLVPRTGRRYRSQQMALWIDLIPRLHRAPSLDPDDFGPFDSSDSACQHQLDNPERDSTFEAQADPDCRQQRKQIPTADRLPVSGITSSLLPVVTPRPPRNRAEQRRTTLSYVTPRCI